MDDERERLRRAAYKIGWFIGLISLIAIALIIGLIIFVVVLLV